MTLRSTRWIWRLGLGLLLVGYLRWLHPAVAPYAGGADASGYLWSARLFRHGALSAPIDVPPGFPRDVVGQRAFAPLGAKVRPGTWDLVPTYPTGFPLHIAAASLILGEEPAVKAVLMAAAAAALCLLYLLGREAGLRRPWALAGCVLLACSPLFLFLAVQPLSDVLATVWAEAAVLLAWRCERRPALAALAGASLGIATLVRPTNVVLALPVLAAMPLTIGHCTRMMAGGLPFAVFLLAYQAWAYGHPLVSGYGDTSSAFSWANVVPSLRHYAVWLPQLASWLIVLVPAAAWAWRGPLSRWRLVAGAWLLAVFGTYVFYYHTSETWWYLRFVLPAFPPLLISALVGFQEIMQAVVERVRVAGARWAAGAIATAVIGACAAALLRSPEFDLHRRVKTDERVYQDSLKWMALQTPPGRPVLMVQTSGAAMYYAPGLRVLRFDWLTPEAWQAIRAWQARDGVTIDAALFEFEREQMFRDGGALLPCNWQGRGHYRQVTFWACPP